MSQRGNRGNKVPERSQALLFSQVSSCQIANLVFIPGDWHAHYHKKMVNVTGTEKGCSVGQTPPEYAVIQKSEVVFQVCVLLGPMISMELADRLPELNQNLLLNTKCCPAI